MGTNASRVKSLVDKAPEVTLRNVADGAETATATETAISLGLLANAYWHDDEVPQGVFKACIHVTAADFTTADETYAFSLLVDDVLALNDSPTTVAALTVPAAAGYYEIVLDSRTIDALVSDYSGNALFMAIRATLGGTTPSITYGAWLSPMYPA